MHMCIHRCIHTCTDKLTPKESVDVWVLLWRFCISWLVVSARVFLLPFYKARGETLCVLKLWNHWSAYWSCRQGLDKTRALKPTAASPVPNKFEIILGASQLQAHSLQSNCSIFPAPSFNKSSSLCIQNKNIWNKRCSDRVELILDLTQVSAEKFLFL